MKLIVAGCAGRRVQVASYKGQDLLRPHTSDTAASSLTPDKIPRTKSQEPNLSAGADKARKLNFEIRRRVSGISQ